MEREAFIVGMGEVGRRLAGALGRADWRVRPVRRDEGWDEAQLADEPGLRIVAVREEALVAVLERLAAIPREKLVLVQNGFLEPVHGDLGSVTRGLIYFTSKGDFFLSLCPSPFYGPAARPLAAALSDGGLETEPIDGSGAFLRAMVVKGFWNCVVGLPLAVHRIDLATYLADRGLEVEALAQETALAAGAQYEVTLDPEDAMRKLHETTGGLGHVRGGAKALAWRNGAVAWFGRRHGLPTPVTDRLLRAAGYDPSSRPSDVAGSPI